MTSNDMKNKTITRREFLRLGGLTIAAVGVLLTGCRPVTNNETPSDAKVPADTQFTLATATPAVQQSAGASQGAMPTATPTTEQIVFVACPVGRVNDPYPGRCARYRDSNNNGYCDFSEPGSGNVPARES
nr:hypothetical protein [Chloroflexota bacterium]